MNLFRGDVVSGGLIECHVIATSMGAFVGAYSLTKGGLHKLSAVTVRKHLKPGVYRDGGGLRLHVSPNGSKRWVIRITYRRQRLDIALGNASDVSLADARELASESRRLVGLGIDPRTARRGRHQPELEAEITFADAWSDFWATKEPQLSNAKHRAQWVSTMSKYVLPKLGPLPVDAVEPNDIIEVLRPLWQTKEETARRILQRISSVFVSAITRQRRSRSNPCLGVEHELGRRRRAVKHHAALPYAAVPAFMIRQKIRNGSASLALQLLILTACRSKEVRHAKWTEINWDEKLWVIPAERMKSKREHQVPLSQPALDLLVTARRMAMGSDLVFPGATGRPLSDMAFTKMVKDWEIAVTAHGFRTSFKVWAAENDVRDEISEAALAHVDQNKVRAAYRRTTYLSQRRDVADRWAAYATNTAYPNPDAR